MNLPLKNHKGSVFLYTLLLMMSISGFIHFELQRYVNYIQGQQHIKMIKSRLNVEFIIAEILNTLDDDFVSETFRIENLTIFIEKTDEIYWVSVSGTSEFSYKYGIISDDSLKWRQIE